jgi:hypothetical protein
MTGRMTSESYRTNRGSFHWCIDSFSQQPVDRDPQEAQKQDQYIIQIEYTCSYSSSDADVATIPSLYILEMNSQLENIAKDLQKLKLPVLEAKKVQILKNDSSPIHH